MKNKIESILKKFPPLFYLARFFWRKFYWVFFVKNLFMDPAIIKKNKSWYKKIKATQLNKKKPLFLDRQEEIKKFFNLNNFYFFKYYLKYDTPNSYRFKQNLNRFFEDRLDKNNLKRSYKEAAFPYVLRLMLSYEKYSLILDYLDFLGKSLQTPQRDWKVLDYGCGVSDIGLLLASQGAEITLCELDDQKFEFTVWRFLSRGFNPKVIKINDTEKYPSLPKSTYDLIIATEVFEHIRDPFGLLKNLTYALKEKRYLFDTTGWDFQKNLEGDHLPEALSIGQSGEFKNYYKTHYLPIKSKGTPYYYLFQKKS